MSGRSISVLIVLALFTGSARADLVAHWKFDEGSGDMAFDSSGNDYHAILVNNPAWVPGKIGSGALNMSGGGYGGIQGLSYQSSNMEQLGVFAWIRTSTGVPQFIASFDRNEYWRFAVGGTNASIGAGLVGWHVQAGGQIDYGSERRVDDGEWHHVGGVFDSGVATIYIDGTPEPSVTGGATWGSGTLRYGYIGKNSEASVENQAGPGGTPLNGDIDDLRIYDHAPTQAEILQIMKGSPPGLASDPRPENDEPNAARDSILGWEPGEFAQKHNVYLGTQFGDVNEASTSAPRGVLVSENQDATTFDPGRLDFDQTYFWRVDEVNGAPDFTVFKGDVWNFTVEPFSIPIANITATASSEFGDSTAERTIDGSGLTGDLHGADAGDMWISGAVPASITWAFDRAYKLHEMWVWNSNQFIEAFIGFGAKDVVLELSLDGENWTVLEGVSELAQAPGAEGYAHNNTIDFGGATAQHVRLNINSVQGFAPQASLSEVRIYAIPTLATGPSPASGSASVSADVVLSWRRDGREAGSHNINLGTDPNALSLAGTVTDSSFDTSASDLALGQTYYWQVVEVNDAEEPSQWAGDVWSFTTVPVIAIDDMEGYADAEFQEIWATWVDGFENPANNGALVGNGAAGVPETTTVYGGAQSLPMHYDNSAAPQSEATRTFDAAMDWDGHGVQSLVLFFQGSSANTGGQLYIKVNDTKIAYHGASSDLIGLGWNKWTIPVSDIGAAASRVTSLTIGVEGGGSGTVYVDEIQLTTGERVLATPTQPSDEGLVARYAFDGDTSDSTGNNPGTLFGNGVFVPGVDGQALNLDGIISYVAIDGLFYEANDITEVTVAAWIRTQDESDQIISSFDRNEYWRLEINGNGGGPGQVGWNVWTSTGQLDYGSSTRVDDGEWHLVVGVFDNGTSTVYIDGHAERSATGGSLLGTGNVRWGFVGTGSEATAFDGAQTANYFIGDLDDVRIYHRALSAAEVAGWAGRTEPFELP